MVEIKVSRFSWDLWDQCSGTNTKCESATENFADDQKECQSQAESAGHKYYQFYAASKQCHTTSSCDSPIQTGWDWRVYGEDCEESISGSTKDIF